MKLKVNVLKLYIWLYQFNIAVVEVKYNVQCSQINSLQ